MGMTRDIYYILRDVFDFSRTLPAAHQKDVLAAIAHQRQSAVLADDGLSVSVGGIVLTDDVQSAQSPELDRSKREYVNATQRLAEDGYLVAEGKEYIPSVKGLRWMHRPRSYLAFAMFLLIVLAILSLLLLVSGNGGEPPEPERITIQATDSLYTSCDKDGNGSISTDEAIPLEPGESIHFVSAEVSEWTVNPVETIRFLVEVLGVQHKPRRELRVVCEGLRDSALRSIPKPALRDNSPRDPSDLSLITAYTNARLSQVDAVADGKPTTQRAVVPPGLHGLANGITQSFGTAMDYAETIAIEWAEKRGRDDYIVVRPTDDEGAKKFWSKVFRSIIEAQQTSHSPKRAFWFCGPQGHGIVPEGPHYLSNMYGKPTDASGKYHSGEVLAVVLSESQAVAGKIADDAKLRISAFSSRSADPVSNTGTERVYVRLLINDDRPLDNGRNGVCTVYYYKKG